MGHIVAIKNVTYCSFKYVEMHQNSSGRLSIWKEQINKIPTETTATSPFTIVVV